MFPSADFFDDGIGIGGPDELFGVGVGFSQKAVDGSLELGDAREDAAFEPPPGQLGEEAFHRVEPGGRGRGEVKMEALYAGRARRGLWDACAWRNRRRSGAPRTRPGLRG